MARPRLRRVEPLTARARRMPDGSTAATLESSPLSDPDPTRRSGLIERLRARDELMTVEEVARVFQVASKKVYTMFEERFDITERRVRLDPGVVADYLEERRRAPGEPRSAALYVDRIAAYETLTDRDIGQILRLPPAVAEFLGLPCYGAGTYSAPAFAEWLAARVKVAEEDYR